MTFENVCSKLKPSKHDFLKVGWCVLSGFMMEMNLNRLIKLAESDFMLCVDAEVYFCFIQTQQQMQHTIIAVFLPVCVQLHSTST